MAASKPAACQELGACPNTHRSLQKNHYARISASLTDFLRCAPISIILVMCARISKSSLARDFFAANPVFTHAEFVAAYTSGGRSEHTSNSLLAKHLAAGRLLRIRRSVYATVPPGVNPQIRILSPPSSATTPWLPITRPSPFMERHTRYGGAFST